MKTQLTYIQQTIENYLAASSGHVSTATMNAFLGMMESGEATYDDFVTIGGIKLADLVRSRYECAQQFAIERETIRASKMSVGQTGIYEGEYVELRSGGLTGGCQTDLFFACAEYDGIEGNWPEIILDVDYITA